MPAPNCRRCDDPPVRGPYCERCAADMLAAAYTSPTAEPAGQDRHRRRPGRPAPDRRPGKQPSLFD